MKSTGYSYSSIFVIVLIAVVLLLVLSCVFGYFCFKKESFSNGCAYQANYIDPNQNNQRFFNYSIDDRLVPTNPIHVPQEVLSNALLTKDQVDNYYEGAKKKRQ